MAADKIDPRQPELESQACVEFMNLWESIAMVTRQSGSKLSRYLSLFQNRQCRSVNDSKDTLI